MRQMRLIGIPERGRNGGPGAIRAGLARIDGGAEAVEAGVELWRCADLEEKAALQLAHADPGVAGDGVERQAAVAAREQPRSMIDCAIGTGLIQHAAQEGLGDCHPFIECAGALELAFQWREPASQQVLHACRLVDNLVRGQAQQA